MDAIPAINWRWLISSLILIAVVLAVFWILSSGFYTVSSNERGVVRRLGKVARETQPGLHFKLPWPMEAYENSIDAKTTLILSTKSEVFHLLSAPRKGND